MILKNVRVLDERSLSFQVASGFLEVYDQKDQLVGERPLPVQVETEMSVEEIYEIANNNGYNIDEIIGAIVEESVFDNREYDVWLSYDHMLFYSPSAQSWVKEPYEGVFAKMAEELVAEDMQETTSEQSEAMDVVEETVEELETVEEETTEEDFPEYIESEEEEELEEVEDDNYSESVDFSKLDDEEEEDNFEDLEDIPELEDVEPLDDLDTFEEPEDFILEEDKDEDITLEDEDSELEEEGNSEIVFDEDETEDITLEEDNSNEDIPSVDSVEEEEEILFEEENDTLEEDTDTLEDDIVVDFKFEDENTEEESLETTSDEELTNISNENVDREEDYTFVSDDTPDSSYELEDDFEELEDNGNLLTLEDDNEEDYKEEVVTHTLSVDQEIKVEQWVEAYKKVLFEDKIIDNISLKHLRDKVSVLVLDKSTDVFEVDEKEVLFDLMSQTPIAFDVMSVLHAGFYQAYLLSKEPSFNK